MGLRTRRSFSNEFGKDLLQRYPWFTNKKARRYSKVLLGVVVCLICISFIRLTLHVQELQTLKGTFDPRPLSVPVKDADGSREFKFLVVTDLDHDSKIPDKKETWRSYLKMGALKISEDGLSASVNWRPGNDRVLTSSLSVGGRAMELSDLVVFNRKLLTIDDRTGIVYQINGDQCIPFVLLVDGPGNVTKPLKGEWMTVKDECLFVGGLGKEWTTEKGEFVNDHPMWVKEVDTLGRVTHHNWTHVYKKLREDLGIKPPGYLIHEAVQWSPVHSKWFFLPRRMSHERYDELLDETRGTNMLISIDENFSTEAKLVRVGKPAPGGYRGYSAFQFIPDTEDILIAALKSEEKEGQPVGSHITVFNIMGSIIMDDQRLEGGYKFEGLAFV